MYIFDFDFDFDFYFVLLVDIVRNSFLCGPVQHRALGSGGRRAGGFWFAFRVVRLDA